MTNQEFKKISKCPKCGQEIDSMTTSCPWCGCQINYKEAVNSITIFNQELQKIDSEKIQAIRVVEEDFQEQINKAWREKKKEELKQNEEDQVNKIEDRYNEKKENYIMNFPVPNTKEDIVQFMTLISSNIENSFKGKSDIDTDVWVSKFNQIKSQAEIAMVHDESLSKVLAIYNETMEKYQQKKKKDTILVIGLLLILFILAIKMMFFPGY